MKQTARLLLVTTCAVFVSLIAYSSINTFLWRIFKDQLSQQVYGTVRTEQLSPWRTDLAYAWADSIVWLGGHESVLQGLVKFPFGLTLEASLLSYNGGLLGVLLVLVLACLGLLLAMHLASRFTLSTRHTGLSEELLSSPDIRRSANRIKNQALLIIVLGMPLLSLVSWFLNYDRSQGSFIVFADQPKKVRYIYDSFHPFMIEWFYILLVLVATVYIFVYLRSKRLIQKIPIEQRFEHQRFCPNKKCHYPVDGNILVCSECGRNWKEGVSKPHVSLLERWGKKVTVLAVITVVLMTTALAITTAFLPYNRVYTWLTLRKHRLGAQTLYLVPSRPVLLQWGKDQVHFVLIPIDSSMPQNSCHFVYQINNQPLRILIHSEEKWDWLMLDAVKVAFLRFRFYPSTPMNASAYGTIQIYVSPDRVIGFPRGESLSVDAQLFLEKAQAEVQ